MASFLWLDLSEIKTILQIDPLNTTLDTQLGLFNEWCASIFEEVLGREVMYANRTWNYPGTGKQTLLLKHRPVYPSTPPAKASTLPFSPLSVTVTEGWNWGEAGITGDTLALGTDYAIRIDQDDGGSREAILYRIGNCWPRPILRQPGELSPFVGADMGSVQVNYTAGWTIDTLPAMMRGAAEMLVARLNNLFPLGQQLSSESYIERSIGLTENQRRYLLGLVRPLLLFWRNWTF